MTTIKTYVLKTPAGNFVQTPTKVTGDIRKAKTFDSVIDAEQYKAKHGFIASPACVVVSYECK